MDVENQCEEEQCESVSKQCMFEKSDSDRVYLKVLIDISSGSEADRDPVFVKNCLLKSMTNNFGQINGLVPVDILNYDLTTNEVLIRCNSMIFQRLTSSIILNDSKLRIQKVSYNNPLGLMFSPRGYNHCSKNNRKRKRNT
ncbi:uncharacterized protein [Halyomorpha halys]|uniref:uncharacterized protein isoform X3 n=1 Tax=Halyomorpha halys TaxID=286706 RepID=UPI0006D52309